MSGLICFETERLVLRQWLSTDRAAFAVLNADPKVMEYFPAQLSPVESDALADRCESLISERGWGFWAAETKQQGSLLALSAYISRLQNYPFLPVLKLAGAWLPGSGAGGMRRKPRRAPFKLALKY